MTLHYLDLEFLKNSNFYFVKNTKAIKKNNKIPKTIKEKINNTKQNNLRYLLKEKTFLPLTTLRLKSIKPDIPPIAKINKIVNL